MSDNQQTPISAMARAAGLDFTVAKAPAYFDPSGGPSLDTLRSFKGRMVAFREDTGEGLGIVSKNYHVHQPAQIADFMEGYSKAAGMTVERMGTFGGGSRIYALAKMDEPIVLPGNDASFPYFLISTSYNGESATIGTYTMIRVSCFNSLVAALAQFYVSQGEQKTRYSTGFAYAHNATFDAKEAAQQAANLYQAALQYRERALMLAQTGVSDEQKLEYFISLVGSIDKKSGMLTPQSRNKIDRLVELYKSGPGADLASAKGTAWGLLNAVTRFVDHEARQRTPDGRQVSAWFGTGQELKRDAEKAALKLSEQRQLVAA
jgi:phage/plasmid-like protein (TIGR03299 family)